MVATSNRHHRARPSFRPDGAAYKRGKTKKSVDLSHAGPSPLRPGERSDNLPVVYQRRPLWLFVQPVEHRSRMEQAVRSVLAAQGEA